MIDVGLGKLSKRVQLESEAADRFKPANTIHLPYCGEDKFRVVLSDGTYIIGYKDVTAGRDEDEVVAEIKDREGRECGSVTLRYRKHNTRLQTDIPAPGDRTPLTTAPPPSVEPPVTRPPEQESSKPAEKKPAADLADFTVRSDSDLEESIESGVHNVDDERVARNDGVSSLRVRVNENCVYRNAPVRCVVGKNEARLHTFGAADGDEAVMPYNSERYVHFVVQTEHKRMGAGKLDLSEIVAANPGNAVRTSVPVYDKDAPVGGLDVSVQTSRLVEPKAKVNTGANLSTAATNGTSTPVAVNVARISHMKKHAEPKEYSVKAVYDGHTYRSDPVRLGANSDTLDVNATLVLSGLKKKYCKLSLVEEDTEAEVGKTYLDVDDRKVPVSKDLTNNAGVCSVSYTTKVDKQARSGFVGATRSDAPIYGVELKVLAAYDLVYENPDDVLDPYVEIHYGDASAAAGGALPHKVTGKSRKNAGLNPIFMETYTIPLSGGGSAAAVQLSIKDKAMLHKDTPIGSTYIECGGDGAPGIYTADLMHESNHYTGSVIYEIRGYVRDQKQAKKASVKQDENIGEYKDMHSTDLSKLSEMPGYTKGLQATIIQVKYATPGEGAAAAAGGASPAAGASAEYTIHNGHNKVSCTGGTAAPVMVVFPSTDSRVLRVDVKGKGKRAPACSSNIDLTEFSDLCKRSPPNGVQHEQIGVLKDDHGRQMGTVKVVLEETEEVVSSPKVVLKPEAAEKKKRKSNAGASAAAAAAATLCTVSCSSCRVRVAEGHAIDADANPFIKINWLNKEARTRTLKTADHNNVRHWEDEFILPTIPYAQDTCVLTLTDDIKMHKDKILGIGEIHDLKSVLDAGAGGAGVEREVTFTSPTSGDAAGRVRLIFYPSVDATSTKLRCVPASEAVPAGTYNSVKLTVICGSEFKWQSRGRRSSSGAAPPRGGDICDPYISVKHDTHKLKGKVHKNAGLNPVFMETYTLPIRDGYPIEVYVSDKDGMGKKDTPIGTGMIELPDLTRTYPAQTPLSVPLKLNGGKVTGYLNCSLTLLKERIEKPAFVAADQKALKDVTAQDLVEFGEASGPTHASIRLRAINASGLPLKEKAQSTIQFSHEKNHYTIQGAAHGGQDPTYPPEVVSLPSTNKAYVKVKALTGTKEIGTGYIYLKDVYHTASCEPRTVDVPLVDPLGNHAGDLTVEYIVSERYFDKACSTPGYLLNEHDMVSAAPSDGAAAGGTGAAPLAAARAIAAPTGETFEALDIELVKLQGIPAADGADPYVQVTLGNQKVRGHTIKNGGATCAVGDLFKVPYQPVEFMKFEVYNDKKLARDPLLSSAKLSLGPIVSNPRYEGVQRLKLPLFKGDGTDGGNLFMKVRGYRDPIYTQATCCVNGSTPDDSPGQSSVYGSSPLYSSTTPAAASSVAASSAAGNGVAGNGVAGHGAAVSGFIGSGAQPYKSMRVEVLNTTHLGVATADPYIVAKLGKHSLRTHTVEDGGENADFGDELYFPYNGEPEMTMTFFNNRRMRRDEEFGSCRINLEPVVSSGDTQVITGRLVDSKTGAATTGEVTVIVTPSTKVEPKAFAVSPLEDDEPQAGSPSQPAAKLPASSLQLDDLVVSNMAKPADGTPLNPYVMTKLGKGKLRSGAPVNQDARGAVEFAEVFQFNTTKAPAPTLSLKAYNNIKMHPDQALGAGELDLLKLTKQEGTFELPLKHPKTGAAGPTVTGVYRWLNEDMGKTKARIIMTPESAAKFATSPTHSVQRAVENGPAPTLDDSVKSYIVAFEKQHIIAGEKPYVEFSLGDHMLRFEPCFDQGSKVKKEEGVIPSDGFAHAILRVKDDLKLKKDHVLYQAHVDMTDLRAGQSATRLVNCMGPNGTSQSLEVQLTASTETVKKAKVTKL